MKSSPWAKLTTSIMPKIRVSPEATNARIMPVTMPLIVWISSWSNGMLERNCTLHAQILMDDGGVGAQLRCHRVVAHHALLDQVDPPSRREGQWNVLLDQQHRDVVLPQDFDDLPYLRDHAGHQPL